MPSLLQRVWEERIWGATPGPARPGATRRDPARRDPARPQCAPGGHSGRRRSGRQRRCVTGCAGWPLNGCSGHRAHAGAAPCVRAGRSAHRVHTLTPASRQPPAASRRHGWPSCDCSRPMAPFARAMSHRRPASPSRPSRTTSACSGRRAWCAANGAERGSGTRWSLPRASDWSRSAPRFDPARRFQPSPWAARLSSQEVRRNQPAQLRGARGQRPLHVQQRERPFPHPEAGRPGE